MQRGQSKIAREDPKAEVPEDSNPDHWVAQRPLPSSGLKCIVVMESNPQPVAASGRMSFGGPDQALERLAPGTAPSDATPAQPGAAPSSASANVGARDGEATASSNAARTGKGQAPSSKPASSGPGGSVVGSSCTGGSGGVKREGPKPESDEANKRACLGFKTLDLREEAELAKRSLNVIVKNLKMEEGENSEKLARAFEREILDRMGLTGEIELAAHRLPRARGKAGPPPLLLTFKTPADKISFLRRRKRLEKTLFTLDDDLTLAQQQRRRELWPTYLQLRQTKAGQPVYWKGAAIYVGHKPWQATPAAPATPDAPV
eukprot:jgi/Mesvir1/17947/Mv12995-RA.1